MPILKIQRAVYYNHNQWNNNIQTSKENHINDSICNLKTIVSVAARTKE